MALNNANALTAKVETKFFTCENYLNGQFVISKNAENTLSEKTVNISLESGTIVMTEKDDSYHITASMVVTKGTSKRAGPMVTLQDRSSEENKDIYSNSVTHRRKDGPSSYPGILISFDQGEPTLFSCSLARKRRAIEIEDKVNAKHTKNDQSVTSVEGNGPIFTTEVVIQESANM